MAKEEKNENKRPQSMSKEDLQQALIDNFINLQKVMTNLAVKFDELSGNMSKLLQLFEISAKTFAEKYNQESPETQVNNPGLDIEYIKKLDTLLDQNKIISKGIMLIEERIREKADTSQNIKNDLEPRQLNQMNQNGKPLQQNQPQYPQGSRPQMDRYPNRQPQPRY